ncbi:MAG: hypothetical protein AAGM67_15845 [Bacteroidota bacterium]
MIRSNLILTMMVTLVAFGVSSCDNTTIASAEIEFEEPMAGEVVADASDVHIHVHFTAMDGELHEVEVMLHPDNDVSDMIIEFDKHEHTEEFVFEQEVDLSAYPAGTEFHLEAKACLDHDCEESETGDIEFSIQ